MSKWFERPVIRLLIILASSCAVDAPTVLAQENAQSGGEGVEAPAGERKRVMISTGLDSQAIAGKWPEHAVWLEPAEGERVLGLFELEAGTPAMGALVILADEGQSAASGLAGALRQPMARAGWAVMTLGLDPPPYALQRAHRQQRRSAPDDSRQGTDDSGSVMIDVIGSVDLEELERQYQTRVQKALAAAAGNLVGRGYDRVAVAGIGVAAAHVARMAGSASVGSGEVSALIWIAPVFDQGSSAALTEWLSGTGKIRVLELHSSRVPDIMGGAGLRSPKQREAALRREGVGGYTRQPVAMAGQPQPRNAPALANRLSAWLASER